MKSSDFIENGLTPEERIDNLMNSPDGLPEYNEKAHDAIRKVLGYLPDKEALLIRGEYLIRVIIHGMEKKGEWDQAFLDNAIKSMFQGAKKPEHDDKNISRD